MAKIPFSKLGVKVNSEIALLTWGEHNIEVRKYLPMEEKANLITNVLNASADDNKFYNPLRVKVFLTLEALYAYTNLSFTEKAKENYLKLYDSVVSSGLFDQVISNIPKSEWDDLVSAMWETISKVYEYNNSVLGLLDNISNDYSGLSLEAAEIQKKLAEGNGVEFLQDVMSKLG